MPTSELVYRDYRVIIDQLHARFSETEVFGLLDDESSSAADIEPDNDSEAKPSGNVSSSEPWPRRSYVRPISKRRTSEGSAASYDAAREMELPREMRNEQVRPPPWSIGIDPQFYKDIDKADKKLQGRILIALAELATKRLVARGDTITPLVRNRKKYWRYRIGDYRLIFFPNEDRAQITLVAFEPRGSIYDN